MQPAVTRQGRRNGGYWLIGHPRHTRRAAAPDKSIDITNFQTPGTWWLIARLEIKCVSPATLQGLRMK